MCWRKKPRASEIGQASEARPPKPYTSGPFAFLVAIASDSKVFVCFFWKSGSGGGPTQSHFQ